MLRRPRFCRGKSHGINMLTPRRRARANSRALTPAVMAGLVPASHAVMPQMALLGSRLSGVGCGKDWLLYRSWRGPGAVAWMAGTSPAMTVLRRQEPGTNNYRYIENFVRDAAGKRFNPHVTIGVGTEKYRDAADRESTMSSAGARNSW